METRDAQRRHKRQGTRNKRERGQALIEMAIALPLMLLVAVAIFEFGRAYQTQQVLTNAAREGARMAVLPDASATNIETRVRDYLTAGQLTNVDDADVDINTAAKIPMGAGEVSASVVTVTYPFQFAVLGPVAKLVSKSSKMPGSVTLSAAAEMRNETQ